MKNSGFVVGGALAGGVLGGTLFSKQAEVEKVVEKPVETHVNFNRALMYLSQEQLQITETAVERIFPADEIGPGAKELGVAFFIDHQLASPWGSNAREYMTGPFLPGEYTQGSQSPMLNRDIFTIGLARLEKEAQSRFSTNFWRLEDEQADEILVDFEDIQGEQKIKLDGITSSAFFALLRNLTIEGVYSDPMYGGNQNMEGWKMKNFPGHQMSYLEHIEKEEYLEIKPQSLSSMHQHKH